MARVAKKKTAKKTRSVRSKASEESPYPPEQVINFGRPTKYRKAFCPMLVEHMESGFSFESFGAVINCGRSVLYDWLGVHKDFLDAKKIGEVKSLFYHEKILNGATMGQVKNFNTATHIYGMKCRFKDYGWGDDVSQDSGESENLKKTLGAALKALDERKKKK